MPYLTYKGLFKNGRFIPFESDVVIPENVTVYIIVIDDEPIKDEDLDSLSADKNTYQQRQRKAVYDFVEAANASTDELTPEDFEEFVRD